MRIPGYLPVERQVSGGIMGIIIATGLILIAGIFLIAYFVGKKKPNGTSPQEEEIIRNAFLLIENIPGGDKFSPILLEQTDIEIKLLKLCTAFVSDGHIQAAKSLARQLTDFAPDLPQAFTMLGMVHIKLDEKDEAIFAFEKALELDEKNVVAANNLGYLFNDKKIYYKAEKYLGIAYDLDPDNTVTLINYGIALYHQKKYEISYQTLVMAYKKSPKNPIIHLYIGKCLEALEDPKAEDAFDRYRYLSEHPETDEAETEQTEPDDENP
jgi:Tfp pilus assembly protein PilF